MKRQIASNPKAKNLDVRVFAVMQEVAESTYGLPIDQLDRTQRSIIFNHGRIFENDNGYIKLTPDGKKRLSAEMKKQYSNPAIKEYNVKGYDYVTLGKGQFGNGSTVYVVQWQVSGGGVRGAGSEQFRTRAEAENWIEHALQARRNPHGFVIIDEHLNVQKRDKDYDKLQEIVDRHNEESGSVWMVVDASDLAEVKSTRNGKHTYKPELQYNHYVLRNDKGDYIRRETDGTIARFKTEQQALNFIDRETLVSEIAEMFENPANLNSSYSAYRNAVYEMARKKGIAINNVDIDLRAGYAIARDNSGYLYEIKLTPKGVSRNWVAAQAWRDNDYSANPITPELRDAIAKESDTLASESERLKEAVGNPNSSTLEDEGYTFVAKLGKTLNKVDRMEAARQLAEFFEAESTTGNYDYMLPKKYAKNPRNGSADAHKWLDVEHKINKWLERNSLDWRGDDSFGFYASVHYAGNHVNSANGIIVTRMGGGRRGSINIVGVSATAAIAEAKDYVNKSISGKVANEHYGKVDFFDDKVDEISAEFTGMISGESMEVAAPDGTPKKLARLGHLRLIKVVTPNGETIEFRFGDNDDAWLVADRRKNLYFVGADANIKGAVKLPKKGNILELGNVVQVDYYTTKQHIESAKPTYFYHELGEVDGITPTAYADDEGFIRLYGGNYDIWTCGIVN